MGLLAKKSLSERICKKIGVVLSISTGSFHPSLSGSMGTRTRACIENPTNHPVMMVDIMDGLEAGIVCGMGHNQKGGNKPRRGR